MKLKDSKLADSLRKAYSAEKAAAFAYVGHAASLRVGKEREAVREIEVDEWNHRENVLAIMRQYGVPVSRWYEIKYHLIGKLIGLSCHLIGRFMPYFFAGKLESGNVCEYFLMMQRFHALDIREHDEVLHEMGIKEKEHEVYFLEVIRDVSWLPFFEKIFRWGTDHSSNDVDLDSPKPPEKSDAYCSRD